MQGRVNAFHQADNGPRLKSVHATLCPAGKVKNCFPDNLGQKKVHRGFAGFWRKGGFDRRQVFHSLHVIRSVKDLAAPKPYVPTRSARRIDGCHGLAWYWHCRGVVLSDSLSTERIKWSEWVKSR